MTIKNEAQLTSARKRLSQVIKRIEEYKQQYSGFERDVFIPPLLDEKGELKSDIEEYIFLKNHSFKDAIQGPLQRPQLIDNIGELLAKLRIASNLTQSELAEKLGWDQSNLSRFESENYSSQTIAKVVEFASALGVFLYVTPSLTERTVDVRYKVFHLERGKGKHITTATDEPSDEFNTESFPEIEKELEPFTEIQPTSEYITV
jgi:transcriptional regulator with XRE-family HTH domain